MFQLNGRIMEERLKHGWTLEQLAEHYDVSTEEFLQVLKKTFSSKAYKGMLGRLEKNKALLSQRKKKKGPTIVLNSDNQNNDLKELESEKIDSSSSEPSIDEVLESLNKQKDVLKSDLNVLELKHKHLTSERTIIRNSIADFKKKLIKLKGLVLEYSDQITSLTEDLDKKLSLMQELNVGIANKQKELLEVDAKISSLQKISIFVYESGEIDIESSFKIEIPECDNELADKIFKDEIADSLTGKQIKSLSKCIILIKTLTGKNLNYEIAFENLIVEECFTKFIKE